MSTLRRYPLSEQATAAMRDRIAAGEWPISHKLPGEQALAQEFGVGRSTIREAIRALAASGLVESRHGSGVYVIATVPTADWPQTIHRAAIADAVEGRIAIEVEAARLAAARRTATDLHQIDTAIQLRDAASEQPADAFIDADLEFHRAVADAAHNEVITGAFTALTPRVREAMLSMLVLIEAERGQRPVDQTEHHIIADAIRKKDVAAAGEASRQHLTKVLTYIQRAAVSSR